MKKLLLSLFISLSFFGRAQKYQPMDSTMVWNDFRHLKNTNCSCPPGCNQEIARISLQFHGYVINNGITWLKMFKSQIRSYWGCQNPCTCTNHNFSQFTNQFCGYLWDDTLTKKVYFTNTLTANFTPSTTNIIYDFQNKNVGDYLFWQGAWPYSMTPMFEILSTDSILFASKYHKTYTVKNQTVFPNNTTILVVEGIGSFLGAFNSVFTDFEQGSGLTCVSKSLSAISVTSSTGYVTATSGCGTINAVQEIETLEVSLHPNPSSTQLFIENIQYENLIVTDVFGKIFIEQNHYSPKISVQNLPTGLYFLRLSSGNTIYNSKFLKE